MILCHSEDIFILLVNLFLFHLVGAFEFLNKTNRFISKPKFKLKTLPPVIETIRNDIHSQKNQDNSSIFLNGIDTDSTDFFEEKYARLFTNPLGIFGHDSCSAKFDNQTLTGICYNELECVLRGGILTGYCGPFVKGGCCIFTTTSCDQKVREKTLYFRNKSYPNYDVKPFQCLLKIRPSRDTCWIRIDYLEMVTSTSGSGGQCVYESFGILNSPDGQSGRVCGYKSGYSVITRSPKNEDLGLSVIVQGPLYKWNIKISQLRCDQIVLLPKYEGCGISNPKKKKREIRSTSSLPQNSDSSKESKVNPVVVKVKKFVRKKLLKPGDPELWCNEAKDQSILGIIRSSNVKSAKEGIKKLQYCHTNQTSEWRRTKLETEAIIVKKQLSAETFQHSFTLQKQYCSPVRQEKNLDSDVIVNPNSGQEQFQKIIDGTETGINEYPWMVALVVKKQQFCGGTLISPEWVLTAAHCTEFGDIENFMSLMQVDLGDHDLIKTNETTNFYRNVIQIIIYHMWHNQVTTKGDIALLKMGSPVSFSKLALPVCFPIDLNETFQGQNATAVGWGLTETGKPSTYLREVVLNILDNSTCSEMYKMSGIKVLDDMLCVLSGPKGTETICNGDSGGPLVIKRNGTYIQVGLTSFGLTECSSMFPAVYTRTTNYLEWIRAAITPVP